MSLKKNHHDATFSTRQHSSALICILMGLRFCYSALNPTFNFVDTIIQSWEKICPIVIFLQNFTQHVLL